MQQVREGEGRVGVLPESEVIKAALRMALGTIPSRVLGLIRDVVLAAFFSRMITDAFVVAFRLPNFFRRVLGEGSIASAFTPLYLAELAQSEESARTFFQSVFIFLGSISATLSVGGIVFMKPILTLLIANAEYLATPGKFALTLWLARLMFLYFFWVTNYAFISALAQAHGRFFWPAVAPAFFNLTIIVGAFMPFYELNGDQLGLAVLVGGVAQNLVVFCALWPILRIYFKKVMLRASVRSFTARLLPTVIGLSGAQGIALLNIYFAAHMSAGALSYIYLADRILELPLSLVAVSLGTALLPTLASLWQLQNRKLFTSTFLRQVEVALFLVLPSALGLLIFSKPIVTVLFQHGHFLDSEVGVTAAVLEVNAAILVVLTITRLVVVALHAAGQNRLPAIISVVGTALHFFVATEFTERLGLMGLIWANFCSVVFIAVANFGAFSWLNHTHLISKDNSLRLGRFTMCLAPALLAMACFIIAFKYIFANYQSNVFAVGLTILLSAAIYLLITRKMGVFKHLEFTNQITAVFKVSK